MHGALAGTLAGVLVLGGRIGAGVLGVCTVFRVVPVGVARRMRVRRGILAALGVRGGLSGHGDFRRMAGRYLRRDRYDDRFRLAAAVQIQPRRQRLVERPARSCR